MTDANQLPGLKLVLINLERSVDRRAAMQNRLATLGLSYEWLRGIDGVARQKELASTVNVPEFCRNVGRDVLPGEIGCYHSHLEAWKLLLKGEHDSMLVLEDDVIFGEDFIFAVTEALQHRDQWDLLKLNCIRAKQPLIQKKIGDYSLNAYLGPFTGMGAYLINRELVERLLADMLPITRPIDHELDRIHVHDFRHYGLEPFPSHVDDGNQSTITGASFDGVRKYPWYRRGPLYLLRFKNLLGKMMYLVGKNRLRASHISNKIFI